MMDVQVEVGLPAAMQDFFTELGRILKVSLANYKNAKPLLCNDGKN
jgi:hypothetical protein